MWSRPDGRMPEKIRFCILDATIPIQRNVTNEPDVNARMTHQSYESSVLVSLAGISVIRVVLYLDDHRQYHRSSLGLGEEVLADAVAEVVADILRVHGLRARGRVLDDFFDFFADVFHEFLVLAEINEAAREDVGRAAELAGLALHGRDDDEHPVRRKRLAVAEHHLADVAHAKPVHEDVACGDAFIGENAAAAFGFNNLAIVGDEDIGGREPGFRYRLSVHLEERMIPLDGDVVFRPHPLEHLLEVLAFRVPSGMDVEHLIVDDFRSFAVELVGEALDRAFVPGDNRGGKHDHVAGLNGEDAVLAVREAHQDRAAFALGAGREDEDFFLRVAVHLLERDDSLLVKVHVSQLLCNLDVQFHLVAVDGDFLFVFLGKTDDLIEAAQEGGEGADDEAALRVADDVLELHLDVLLGELVSALAGVRRVGEERQNPALAERLDLLNLGAAGDVGLEINLEVDGMDDASLGGVHHDPERPRDVVGDAKEFGLEAAESQGRGIRNDIEVELRAVVLEVLLAPRDDGAGDVGRIDRDAFPELRHDVGDGADMIVVGVGDNDPADVFFPGDEILHVRDDVVDPGHILLRKLEPQINDDDVVPVFDGGHVAANFFEAADRDDAEFRTLRFGRSIEGAEHERYVPLAPAAFDRSLTRRCGLRPGVRPGVKPLALASLDARSAREAR